MGKDHDSSAPENVAGYLTKCVRNCPREGTGLTASLIKSLQTDPRVSTVDWSYWIVLKKEQRSFLRYYSTELKSRLLIEQPRSRFDQ